MGNGVKQGVILFAILCTVYIDKLLTGVDLEWWGPWGKQRGGGPFVVVRKKISVKSYVFKTRQIWINFLVYNYC